MKYHVTVRKFQQFLKKLGFKKKRQKGSHVIYDNGVCSHVFTIQANTHTYSQGHLKKLLKDFCLTLRDLKNFLK